LAASVYAAGPRLCSEPTDGIPPDHLPWPSGQAIQNVCEQFYISGPTQVSNYDDQPRFVAAFNGGKLIGLRDRASYSGKPIMFNPAEWAEVGQMGQPGELWWGRTKNGAHIIVGQESYVRVKYSQVPPDRAAARAFAMQQAEELRKKLEAFKAGRPIPAPASPPALSGGKPDLFPRTAMEYLQVDGTTPIFSRWLGGKEEGVFALPPGRISNAILRLDTVPVLSGSLEFDIDVEGYIHHYTIPVIQNSSGSGTGIVRPEERYRIRSAELLQGQLVNCMAPNSSHSAPGFCAFPRPVQPAYSSNIGGKERYSAYGAFFGDHATWAAVNVRLYLDNSKNTSRSDIQTDFVLVLQAQ
jgi:hypothetical protein